MGARRAERHCRARRRGLPRGGPALTHTVHAVHVAHHRAGGYKRRVPGDVSQPGPWPPAPLARHRARGRGRATDRVPDRGDRADQAPPPGSRRPRAAPSRSPGRPRPPCAEAVRHGRHAGTAGFRRLAGCPGTPAAARRRATLAARAPAGHGVAAGDACRPCPAAGPGAASRPTRGTALGTARRCAARPLGTVAGRVRRGSGPARGRPVAGVEHRADVRVEPGRHNRPAECR
jgi:hypothetical protein